MDAFGELVGIAFPQRSQFSSEMEKPRLEKEASRHEVVLQYAKMLADVDEYKLVQFGNTVTLPTNGQRLYHYRLYYMVNGVETSDYVAVSILDRGGLMYLDVLQNKWASTPGPCFEETSAIAQRAMFGQAGLGRGPTSACEYSQARLQQ